MNRNILPVFVFTVLGCPWLAASPAVLADARAALQARDLPRASALATPLVDDPAAGADACALLAEVSLLEKNPAVAVKWAEKATTLAPDQAGHHALLGSALGQRLGELPFLQQAVMAGRLRRAFARAVELDPRNLGGLIGLSRYHANAPEIAGGSTAKAREFAERVRQINPYLGWLEFAHIAGQEQQFGEVVLAYEEADKLKPLPPGLLLKLAEALIAADRKAEARARLEQIAPGTPRHAEAQALLATLSPASGAAASRP